MRIDAFMCYAPRDHEHAEMLARGLAALEAAGVLALRWDGDITAGSRFTDALRDRLDAADLVVLLVSKAFLGSNFCQDQMNHAMAKGMVVVPVILENCDWMKSAARRPECLPSDGNPVSAWKSRADAHADVARGVAAACERYVLNIEEWAGELGEEESAIMRRLYPEERLDGLTLWDPSYAWNSSYLPTFMELLGEKKYIDRDFYFSVTFPFWRQRFWLTKRGQRVAARYLASKPDTPPVS